MVGMFPGPSEPIQNYRYLQLEMDADAKAALDEAKLGMLKTAENNAQQIFNWGAFKKIHQMNKNFLKHPVVEQLKRDEKFDLVVLGWFINDFQVGIAAHFGCPAVIISGTPALKTLRDYVGNPSGVSYQEFPLYPIKGVMTFKQRVFNHLFFAIEAILFNAIDYFIFEPNYVEYFPPDKYPSYAEAKRNVALVMVSTHFSQASPIATFPGLIEISGIQIKKEPNPLPADIKAFLDGATDGAIFMSFGSNINSVHMSVEKRDAVLRVFGKLKQRVLWKWEDDELPGKPDNVMIGKWLPQDDILAHPNVRLFISHCGKGSVNEARSHGVPILAIPMFGDQPSNADVIVQEGFAVKQVYGDMTEETLAANVKEALLPKYREVVKRSADLYKDRPAHPLDTAIYWVEYVLRHKGAPHMRSQAVNLNWIQTCSLDVIAFLLALVYVSLKVFVFVIKNLWRMCCGKKTKFVKAKRQ